jgi:hypothetical protein
VNKEALTCISAELFLRKIVTSLYGYEQDVVLISINSKCDRYYLLKTIVMSSIFQNAEANKLFVCSYGCRARSLK